MGISNTYYMLAPYLRHLGVSDPATIGWVLGMYYGANTFSRPLVGWFVERFSFRTSLMGGGLAVLVSTIGLALVGDSVPGIMFWRAFTGLASSLYIVALTTYQTLAVPAEKMGSSFALVSAGCIAPLITFIPLSEWLLHGGNSILYIWIPPATALFCLVLSISFPLEEGGPLRDARDRRGSYRELFALPAARTLFISQTLFSLTDAAMLSLALLAGSLGLVTSAFISANAAVSIVIRLTCFRLLDSVPRMKMAALTLGFTSLALILATFARSNLTFMLCGCLFGVGMGVGFPLHLALIGDVSPPHLRAKTTSMVWFFMSICFFISPLLIGYLTDFIGVPGAFRSFSIPLLISAPLIHYFLWKPLEKRKSDVE
jgi:MFS family permease